MKTKKIAARAGLMGIFVNACLFIAKYTIGTFTGSISIISDAFNNLSDFLSSFITFLGFKISQKPKDKTYPFGYERFEYISGFLISIIMIYIGIDTLRNAISVWIHPKPIQYSIWMVIILILSITLKTFLYFYYRYKNKKVGSDVLYAVSQDSLFDVLISGSLLVGFAISYTMDLNLDAALGVLISLVITVSSSQMIRGFVRNLVGSRPSKETIESITNILDANHDIFGYHDLLIHEYGEETVYGSVHIELDENTNLNEAHRIVDALEKRVLNEAKVDLTMHLDPIDVTSQKIKKIHHQIKSVLKSLDPELSFHDLRVVFDVVSFDIKMVEDCQYTDTEIQEQLADVLGKQYELKITFDYHSLI